MEQSGCVLTDIMSEQVNMMKVYSLTSCQSLFYADGMPEQVNISCTVTCGLSVIVLGK